MKRMAGVLIGAAVLALTLAGTALAGDCGYYTCSPSATTVVKGNQGGTAFTGGNVSTAAIAVAALAVVGLVALFAARRRAAHSA
jgi:MYXO-CTERM domain-containing protein